MTLARDEVDGVLDVEDTDVHLRARPATPRDAPIEDAVSPAADRSGDAPPSPETPRPTLIDPTDADRPEVEPHVPARPTPGVPATTSAAGDPAGRGLGRERATRLVLVALLLLIAGTTGGYLVAALTPPTYAARADLIYPLTAERPTGFLREDRSLTTQVALLTSRAVLGPVARANRVEVEALGAALSAEVLEGSEIIQLEVRNADRTRGVLLLDAVIRQYLSITETGASEDTRAYLEAQIEDSRIELARDDLTDGEREALAARQVALLGQLDAINLSGAQARVVVDTYSAPDPVSPRPLFAAATGAVTSAIVAAVVVALLARRWTRPRE